MKLAICLLVFVTLVSSVFAHQLQPAYLELRQIDADTYDMLFKVPAGIDGRRLDMHVVFPPGCTVAQSHTSVINRAYLDRWRIKHAGGLRHSTIRIAGLSATMTDVLVRVLNRDGTTQVKLLKPYDPMFVVEATPHRWRATMTYVRLGIEHILMGVDHLLFVLGLLLIVGMTGSLLKTITAFTVAHSITLAVATLGYASVPLAPLNAMIAFSILLLGPEVVRVWRGETSFTIKYPWGVAFLFGLMHGFGFASGLKATGLPQADIAWALVLFNVGVEIGQVFFVGLMLTMTWSFRTLEIRWPRWALALPGYTVGTLGAFWTIQRIAILIGGIQWQHLLGR